MTQTIPSRQVRLILILLGLVAYAPVLRLGFLWDDHVFIEQNPYIRGWTLANIKHDISSTVSNGRGDAGYLRPVVTWSNRLDFSIWGLRPFGYHLTSLALHLGNTLLLYELLLILGCSPMAALLTSSLFAVHPIGVEGLICVTGRATFLSFFFGLAALLFWSEPNPKRVLLGLGSFALALFSKEESVIVPLLIPLLWNARSAPKRSYLLLAPIFALLAIYLIYRHFLFGALGAPPNYRFTISFFLEAFPRILTHYVRLILVPWNLHSHRLIMPMSHFWVFSLIGWTALGIYSWIKRAQRPRLYFCVFWFVIGLLPPAMAMVDGGFILDHWGYWVAPAVLLPLGLLFDKLWENPRRPREKKLALLFFPLLIAYALLVHLNVELRGTDEKMYRWALHFTTSHPIKFNLGSLLLRTGRAQEAIPYFEDVKAVYPEDLNNLFLLALAYRATGQEKLAMHSIQDILQRDPSFPPAVRFLDESKTSRGRT
jgi:protein O-mannosyl-transferase